MKKMICLFLGTILMGVQFSLYSLSRGLVVISLGYAQDGKDKLIYGIIQPDDVVVRAQGAGINKHHVIVDGIDYDLTYIPSAFLIPKVKVYLAGGMVVELPKLSTDIKDLKAKGVQDVEGRLRISTNAHLIMPYHKIIDACAHKADHVRKGLTLRSGVRPASSDKRFGIGIRLADLFSDDFSDLLKTAVNRANDIIVKLYNEKPVDYKKLLDEYMGYRKEFLPYVRDQVELKLNLLLTHRDGPRVIFEGSHSVFLDVTHGDFPYVSAGSTTASGICAEAGVGPTRIGHTLGVVQAYCTVFHDCPFPTEIKDEKIVTQFNEKFKRKKSKEQTIRYGWPDAVMYRQGIMLNGVNSIAISRLDDLCGLEEIKLGVHYQLDGVDYDYRPPIAKDLARVKVSYKTFKGWKEPIGHVRKFCDLPEEARHFVKTLERVCGVPVTYISVGPEKDQLIEVVSGLVPQSPSAPVKKVHSKCVCEVRGIEKNNLKKS